VADVVQRKIVLAGPEERHRVEPLAIVPAHNKEASARFLAKIFGLNYERSDELLRAGE